MIEVSVQGFLLYALFAASGLLIFVNLLHKWTGWLAKRRLRKIQLICRICGYHFFAHLPENTCMRRVKVLPNRRRHFFAHPPVHTCPHCHTNN